MTIPHAPAAVSADTFQIGGTSITRADVCCMHIFKLKASDKVRVAVGLPDGSSAEAECEDFEQAVAYAEKVSRWLDGEHVNG